VSTTKKVERAFSQICRIHYLFYIIEYFIHLLQKKYKRTNNDLQIIHIKLKIE